jgi:hypothetical protein
MYLQPGTNRSNLLLPKVLQLDAQELLSFQGSVDGDADGEFFGVEFNLWEERLIR